MTEHEQASHIVYERAVDLLDMSVRSSVLSDEIYLNDQLDAAHLQERYESLSLSRQHRLVIDDYLACDQSRMSRAVVLAYRAGIRTALSLMHKYDTSFLSTHKTGSGS